MHFLTEQLCSPDTSTAWLWQAADGLHNTLLKALHIMNRALTMLHIHDSNLTSGLKSYDVKNAKTDGYAITLPPHGIFFEMKGVFHNNSLTLFWCSFTG